MPSNHLILCRPLLLLPSIFPSIRVFSNESVLHNRLPNYCRLSISSSNEIQDWSPLELTGLISLLSKGLSRVFSNTTFQKHQFFGAQLSLWSTLTSINDYWKNHSFDGPFSAKSSLLFNMLSRFIISFLPRSKHLLISCFQSPSAVILEPNKIRSVTLSTVSPSICHEVVEPDAMILVFWM